MMMDTERQRIVVVHDDATVLGMIEVMLAIEGYSVAASSRADLAYPVIRDIDPDLAILGVPAWGGPDWQLLDKLKLDDRTAVTPVLVCSASPTVWAAEARLRELGCDALEMPFELDDLLAKVHSLVATRTPRAVPQPVA